MFLFPKPFLLKFSLAFLSTFKRNKSLTNNIIFLFERQILYSESRRDRVRPTSRALDGKWSSGTPTGAHRRRRCLKAGDSAGDSPVEAQGGPVTQHS